MIQSYKKHPNINQQFDSIIIGSGIGSLTTAAALSKQGKKVLILEQHYTAGGFTHVFKRKGFEWDVGIHYIGEMQRSNSVMKKTFDYITNSQMQWADMGEVYDQIIIGNKQYDLVKGVKNFKAKMIAYFPDEEAAIKKYIDLVFKATKSGRGFFAEKTFTPIKSWLLGWYLKKDFKSFAYKTTYEVMSGLTDNQELIKVLTGQYGDYGLTPKQSSFYMHATVARHYFDGGSYPIGGSSKIVDHILPIIEKSGGMLMVRAEVENIIIKNNKAIGVKMKDGNELFANTIISGVGIFNTYQQLLPTSVFNQLNLKQHLRKIKPSVAHLSLYLGLEGTTESLGLNKANLWIYPEKDDHDTCVNHYLNNLEEQFPVVYVSFPSAKDPEWAERYPNKSTIEMITLVPYELFETYEGSKWMHRSDEYNQLKQQLTERLLDVLYAHRPQVKGKIIHQELSTPLTTKHFVKYQKGEIYGLDHSPERFKQSFLRPRTGIKQLFLTGQDIVTAGIGGAMISGVITASVVSKKNVLKEILN